MSETLSRCTDGTSCDIYIIYLYIYTTCVSCEVWATHYFYYVHAHSFIAVLLHFHKQSCSKCRDLAKEGGAPLSGAKLL